MAEQPSQLPLSLGNIKHLDLGRVHTAFDEELKHIVKDCNDRPTDKNPRTVNLVIRLKPIPDTHGSTIVCHEIEAECEVSSTVPKRRSKLYTMRPKNNGVLVFQPESPDDPDQEALFDRDEEEKRG